MMKQHYDMPQDPTGLIHLVEAQNYYLNCHQFDSHKTIGSEEGFPEEGSLGEEDSLGEVEDSQEVEDTLEEEEVLLVLDHLVEDGVHHLPLYHKATMAN